MKDEIIEIRKTDVIVKRNGSYVSLPIISEDEFEEKEYKRKKDLELELVAAGKGYSTVVDQLS